MGPTASGKTDLAFKLVDEFNCSIISVDAAQTYCGMNIGTGKPDAQTLEKYPHRLIDIRDPAQTYSAADFRSDAIHEINNIHEQGKIPLLVGGTSFYFSVLENGLTEMPSADVTTRAKIWARAEKEGWPALHQELALYDSETATKISVNDKQRIQRTLEVISLCGKTPRQLTAESTVTGIQWPLIKLCIAPSDRRVLHTRIAQRFDLMLKTGLIDEVKALRQRGDLRADNPSMRTVGYRQVWEYLDGGIDKASLREKGTSATRQLAKRQLTWLRAQSGLVWFDTLYAEYRHTVLQFLHNKMTLI